MMTDSSSRSPQYPPPPSNEDVKKETQFLAEMLWIWKLALKDDREDWNPDFDLVVLTNVARSYLDDIWRYEVYHIGLDLTTHANAIKRAGYLTKWLCRLRPMYIHRPTEKFEELLSTFDPAKDDSLLINESLAIHLSLQILAAELGVADIVLRPAFYDRFIYGLHFRHFHEDSVLEIYEIIYNEVIGLCVTVK